MKSSGVAPTMGGLAERTKASWARRIPTYAAVPPAYRAFFEPLRSAGQDLPYAVLAPSREGFLHRGVEKLVCVLGQEVHVLEKAGNTFQARCFPLPAISYVEFRAVLLDAHVKICGLADRDAPACCTIRFNAVGDYLFRPIVETMRRAATGAGEADRGWERAGFEHLVRVNYKFMSYARHSLLPGETVVQSILQPEIREVVLTLLGRTYHRSILPTHMAILTDCELITIREEQHRGADRYGGVWTYIPLKKIVALSLAEQEALLRLSIELPAGASLASLFEASARQELEQLIESVEEQRPAA